MLSLKSRTVVWLLLPFNFVCEETEALGVAVEGFAPRQRVTEAGSSPGSPNFRQHVIRRQATSLVGFAVLCAGRVQIPEIH